ncbi:unnamed protein product [Caenorhabditis auriculariae]|uniref:Galactokinase n=1 Tax=Caenorhabditis auriculariae TaxID=2777116 RepID=A0A8S1HGL9_9PELO|nr:unnamed protein product [Caenorhabditis auriculariae]
MLSDETGRLDIAPRLPPPERDDTREVAQTKLSLIREAFEIYKEQFDKDVEPTMIRAGIAPGRVNLIGEHVDYCDGIVLPMAVPFYVVVLGVYVDEDCGETQIYSSYKKEKARITAPYKDARNVAFWASYIHGVMTLASCRKCFNIVVHSNLPPGSGMSSSAALELATYKFLANFDSDVEARKPLDIALLCREAEHRFAHVPCGIMDQFVVTLAYNGCALRIDCRSLQYELIPALFMDSAIFLVTNSGVKHELGNGEYAKRREVVDKALKTCDALSWRDVNDEKMDQIRATGNETMVQYSEHVIDEIKRTETATIALLDNNVKYFGELMTESHISLRDKYQVSCEELDQLVDIALKQEGVFGSRMFGGGFGGCTITLVKPSFVQPLKKAILEKYTGGAPTFFVCEPVSGAKKINDISFIFPKKNLF